MVRYQSLMKDKGRTELEENIKFIENYNLEGKSRTELLSFYMNAYNIVVMHKNIIRLNKNPKWKGNTGFLSKVKYFTEKHVVSRCYF